MKRITTILLLVTLVASLFTGVASAEAAPVTEITYAHLGDWAIPYLEAAAKDFEAETGIKVNIQAWTFQDGYQKYVTSFEGGAAPDCGMGFSDWLAEFYERGVLVPLDDVISPEYEADMYEGAKEAGMYKGQLLGVPFATSIRYLICRPDLYEAKGLAVPTTVDELVAASKAVSNPPETYGFGLCAGRNKNTVEFYLELLWPYGGEILNEDGSAVAFNSPEGIQALKTFKELTATTPAGYLTTDHYLAENAFTAGNLAAMVSANWIITGLAETDPEAKAEIVPILTGPNGDAGNLYIADLLYVFNDEKAEACMKWIEFYKSNEKYLGEAFVEYGFAPDLKSHDDWAFMQTETAKIIGEATTVARPKPATPAWSQIEDALAVAIGKVCADEMTPEEALAEAEIICNEAIEFVS